MHAVTNIKLKEYTHIINSKREINYINYNSQEYNMPKNLTSIE